MIKDTPPSHRRGFCGYIKLVRPAVLQLNDLILDIFGQRLDFLRSCQKFLEILQLDRSPNRRADLRKAVCKTDAKLGPILDEEWFSFSAVFSRN